MDLKKRSLAQHKGKARRPAVPLGNIVHRVKRLAPTLIRIWDTAGQEHALMAFGNKDGVAQLARLGGTAGPIDLHLSDVHPIEVAGAKILRMRKDWRSVLISRGTSSAVSFAPMPAP